VSTLWTHLTWSHYFELLSIKDINKLMYYINIVINNNLSKRELQETINNNEYVRLSNENKLYLLNQSI
jgi:predicted nuclease of restriction endonuclease-like (RecB) superfamily